MMGASYILGHRQSTTINRYAHPERAASKRALAGRAKTHSWVLPPGTQETASSSEPKSTSSVPTQGAQAPQTQTKKPALQRVFIGSGTLRRGSEIRAKKRTRTSTSVRTPAPQAGASAIPPPSRGLDHSLASQAIPGKPGPVRKPLAQLPLGPRKVGAGGSLSRKVWPQKARYLYWLQFAPDEARLSAYSPALRRLPRVSTNSPMSKGLRTQQANRPSASSGTPEGSPLIKTSGAQEDRA